MSERTLSRGLSGDDDIAAQLDEQKRRHARLQERQRLARLELDRRSGELEAARHAARAAFDTDDPDVLRALLAESRRRNAEAVSDFRRRLDAVERALDAIGTATDPVATPRPGGTDY